MRVSSNMENDNFLYYNHRNEVGKNTALHRLNSHYRIGLLRDDPTMAAHSIRLQGKINRLAKYEQNTYNVINNMALIEGNINEAYERLLRIRDLTVQGANGTYGPSELRYMAIEVNEQLEALLDISNQLGADGLALFAGTRTSGAAFVAQRGNLEGADGLVITGVEYIGNNASRDTEYSDGSRVPTHLTGNTLFWAENQKIWGTNAANGFTVPEDTAIVIDNVRISLKAGDTVEDIVERINQADISVHASLDPMENVLVLNTTEPHQLWLSDVENGTVLADLGLLAANGQPAPDNLNPEGRVVGGSMFDMVINIRDAMLAGDQNTLGGIALGGIDLAMDNMNLQRAKLSSRNSLLQVALHRVEYEHNNYQIWDDVARGLDYAEAITELNTLETAMQASYRMAASTFSKTLMDFLR